MPQNRAGRLFYALVVLVLLGIIGRNIYLHSLNKRLIAAIEHKNSAAVREMLDRGADPNCRRPPIEGPGTEKSALALALYGGNLSREQQDIVCLLLEHGAAKGLDAKTRNDYLLTVCRSGIPAIVRCLLEHGADANARETTNRSGVQAESAMDLAISYLTNGVGIPNISESDWSAEQRLQVETDRKQHRAASQEMVHLLQEHGAHLTLWQAAKVDDIEALRAALDAGTAIDTREPSPGTITTSGGKSRPIQGPTALTLAAREGNIQCVRLLLERGANINVLSDFPASALEAAISGRHLDIVRLLLQRGADMKGTGNTPASFADSPLVSACYSLPELVPELLRRGAEVKSVGSAALSSAIRGKHPELVTLLLKHGASVRGKAGYNVLYLAIQYQPDLVPLFLAEGADAHETDRGYAALISQAVRYKRKNLIIPLLHAGASINVSEYIGGTVTTNAPQSYSTPLVEAIPQGLDIVRLLLEQGADPNRSTSHGETPLIIASLAGNVDVTRLLLKYGAKVDGTGGVKRTPLYFAIRHKHPEVVEILQQAGGHEN